MSLPHLIALKLYAGGPKSQRDILDLLEHNEGKVDLDRLTDICARYSLTEALNATLAKRR